MNSRIFAVKKFKNRTCDEMNISPHLVCVFSGRLAVSDMWFGNKKTLRNREIGIDLFVNGTIQIKILR
jgi:hypothetical protein